MNPCIFWDYDIRARVDLDLTIEGVYRLGQALGAYFRRQGKSRLVVGRDCRAILRNGGTRPGNHTDGKGREDLPGRASGFGGECYYYCILKKLSWAVVPMTAGAPGQSV